MPKKEMARIKIKTVIDKALERIRAGKRPSIMSLMLELGYSYSSAHALKIIRSETWEEEINKLADKAFLEAVKKVLGLRKRSYRPKRSGKIVPKGDVILEKAVSKLVKE